MGDLLSHRNLLAWQEAIKLVEIVYRETSDFPKMETFGLASQLRRSAVSISANIAEGAGRQSTRELIRYLAIASGSRAELDTHLEIATRLGMMRPDSESHQKLQRVGKLLAALRESVRRRLNETSR